MKLDELLKLINAGYTKADIEALESQQNQQNQQNQQDQQNQQNQQDQQSQQNQQNQQDQQSQQNQQNNAVLAKLGEILNAVQLSNIAGIGTGGNPAGKTADDVVKEMFNIK